jgi:excisionase family DNA binding protein
MNKKEAADYLGITTRALEYHQQHAKDLKLVLRYEKGKTGDVAIYDEGELRKLKAKLDARRTPRPAVVTDTSESPEGEPRSLARLTDVAPGALLERLTAALEHNRQRINLEPTITDLSNKLTLSLAEAAQLSGVSRNHLREAIGKGKLKARIIGRGWRIKRAALDAYVAEEL